MSLQIAIVGLPNVGKSTLFNALTKTQAAQAANYPFCTIDPNVGMVEVPDARLEALSSIVKPERVQPALVEFVDVAGLVKGASQGEGLGNQFLSHIRQCDAIAQVVRHFEDKDITHVHDSVHPRRDREIIETELILADLQTLEKRMLKSAGEARSGDKTKKAQHELYEKVKQGLEQGVLVVAMELEKEEKELLRDLHLITAKPIMYIVNMREDLVGTADVAKLRQELEVDESVVLVPISAKVESDLMDFTDEEAKDFLQELGLEEPGLHRVIRESYRILGLETYFTAGEKEVRAWTIHKGDTAPQAAGVIHTDFEKGFIRADVVGWQDFVELGGWSAAREKGKVRSEGKEYITKDGDVMLFKFAN